MRLYVSIPSYGGQIETRTAARLMTCLEKAMVEGLVEDYNVNFLGDSLIHRIRNAHANHALQEKYDRLFTIDSDIDFTWEDFRRIISSPHDIIGGSYPLKCFPIVVNFNPLPDKGRELLKTDRCYDLEAFTKFKELYADKDGIAPVTHLPTGFLCVKTEVLKKLSETAQKYVTLAPENGQRRYYHHFYPSEVVEYDLESEDWGFCRIAEKAGYTINFDTRVIVGHIGKHIYRLGQVFGEVDVSEKKREA